VEIGQLLINRGADLDAQQDDGWTSLHLAALFGHIDFMRLLLDRGANPHARDNFGETPSQVARTHQQQEISRLLSEYSVKSEEE
jgi:ankyrin repeat protein